MPCIIYKVLVRNSLELSKTREASLKDVTIDEYEE
jgi:hypothetical protein